MLVSRFNKSCNIIVSIYLKVGDLSTSAISFCTTSKGNLPHFSYIFCKPELLGSRIKIVVCCINGYMILLEIKGAKIYK